MEIKIPVNLEYDGDLIELNTFNDGVLFELKNGRNKFISDPIESGVATFISGETQTLFATLSFIYDFNQKESELTIMSSDFESEGAPAFTIEHPGYPKITSKTLIQKDLDHSLSTDIPADIPFLPGLAETFAKQLAKVNKTIIREATQKGISVFVRRPLPKLDSEDYLNLSSVYDAGGNFVEMFDSGVTYDSTHSIVHISSIFKGTAHWGANQDFANVIGSTNDPKVDNNSWIKLWESRLGLKRGFCASFQFNGFICSDRSDQGENLVGGHVIKGKTARKVQKGKDVYIIPICNAHNNNDKVYMKSTHVKDAIWLGAFMQKHP